MCSNFADVETLMAAFEGMPATGIKYVMYNLRNEREFDVKTDPHDVQMLTVSDEYDEQRTLFTLHRKGQAATVKVM
jgi:hypothetical protein